MCQCTRVRLRSSSGASAAPGAGHGLAAHLDRDPQLVVLTRLAVSYEALPIDELEAIAAETNRIGVPLFVDDAGGARVRCQARD